MDDTAKAYAAADSLIAEHGAPKSDEALRILLALAYTMGSRDATAELAERL